MRNLKKILALVLALVMSLSLMATAGAADTTASGETITPAYQTAIDVLKGVEVFRGYEDGTIRPQNTITRAEVAAILYRIATGDVNDAKVSIYTDMANVNFTDLANANWAKGYINYCANAQLIVGMGDGTFKPQQNITGYATLAMVLRALGYDKNGEFKGSGWEIRTAAQARELGILKNVTSDLGSYATRELVSELLFRAILCETVTYSPLNQNLYQKTGKTLAKENLGLEEIEGVVVANEWANLYGDSVIAADTTNLEVAKDDIRTLKEGTGLQDVGMSKLVYTQTDARNTYKVIKIADSGKNNVQETGAATDISTAAKFSKAAGMPEASDIEYYVNFDRTGKYSSDYRLEFSVTFKATATQTADEIKEGFEKSYVSGLKLTSTEVGMKAEGANTYSKIIRAEEPITDNDLAVIRGIFASADYETESTIYEGIDGYVYAGTKSNPNLATVSHDLSDTMSYRAFVREYINAEAYDVNWNSSENGEWVKFIDNDDDGYIDYAFKTEFTLDKVVSSYKKSDETKYVFYALSENDVAFDWLYDSMAVGDVVLTFTIDGVAHINLAEYDTDVVKTVNYKDVTITLNNGTVREQSGIYNATRMPGKITDVDEKVEYNLYRDYFDYVRAYEETAGTQYALVTEAYFTNNNASAFVQNWPVTVELAIGETSGTAVTPKEYNLVGGANNDFVSRDVWSSADNNRLGNLVADNYLQPATEQLGHINLVRPTAANGSYVYWNWNGAVMSQRVTNWTSVGSAFDYGAYGDSPATASFTNVARYTLDGDNASLTSAARARASSDYYNVYYDIDYIQLSTANVAAGARQYDIHNHNYVVDGVTYNYRTENNLHVSAVHDTQYYIVSEDGVYYFTDYANVPAITAAATGGIHAAYAVARNVNADRSDEPYWVADVIVYEVKSWDPNHFDSVALAYFLNSKTTGEVQYISALDNEVNKPDVTITPDNRYWTTALTEGFYRVYDQEVDGSTMTASKIEKIVRGEYNKYGIYASIADRVYEVDGRGEYIEVENDFVQSVPKNIDLNDTTVCYSISSDSKSANELVVFDDYLSVGEKSDIQKGDFLIWVLNQAKNRTAFVVNLGPVTDGTTPIQAQSVSATKLNWLIDLWEDIIAEQGTVTDPYTLAIRAAQYALDVYNDKNDMSSVESLTAAYDALLAYRTANYATLTGEKIAVIDGLLTQLQAAIDDLSGKVEPVDPTQVDVSVEWVIGTSTIDTTVLGTKDINAETKSIELGALALPTDGAFEFIDGSIYELKSVTVKGDTENTFSYNEETGVLTGGDFSAPITVVVVYDLPDTNVPGDDDGEFGGEFVTRMTGRTLAVGDTFQYRIYAKKSNTVQPGVLLPSIPAGLKVVGEPEYEGTSHPGRPFDGMNSWIYTFDTTDVSEADYAKYIAADTRDTAMTLNFTAVPFTPPTQPTDPLQAAKDAAVVAINAKAAEWKAKPGMMLAQHTAIDAQKNIGLDQVDKATSVEMVEQARLNAIANIEKIQAPGSTLDDPTVNVPTITTGAVAGTIDLKYYLPNGGSLTEDAMLALINNNAEGITFTKGTFKAESVNGSDGFVTEAQAVVYNDKVEYVVTLTHMYLISVNGIPAGYVSGHNGTTTYAGTVLANVPVGNYLLEETVADAGQWATSDGTSLTLNTTATSGVNYLAAKFTNGVCGYADRNYVTAYGVTFGAGCTYVINVTPAPEYATTTPLYATVTTAGTIYVQEGAALSAYGEIAVANDAGKTWYELTLNGVADVDTAVRVLLTRTGETGPVVIDKITRNNTIGLIRGVQVVIDGDVVGVYPVNNNDVVVDYDGSNMTCVKYESNSYYTPYFYNKNIAGQESFVAWYSAKVTGGQQTKIDGRGQYVWDIPAKAGNMLRDTVNLVSATRVNTPSFASVVPSGAGNGVGITFTYEELQDLLIYGKNAAGGSPDPAFLPAADAPYWMPLNAELTFTGLEDSLKVTFAYGDGSEPDVEVLTPDANGNVTVKLEKTDGVYNFSLVSEIEKITFTPSTTVASATDIINGTLGNTINPTTGLDADEYEIEAVSVTYTDANGATQMAETKDEILAHLTEGGRLTIRITVAPDANHFFTEDTEVVSGKGSTFSILDQHTNDDGYIVATISWSLTLTD